MIGLKGVTHFESSPAGAVPVLIDATFVFPREPVALLGTDPIVRRSLVDLLAGLVRPSEGRVQWAGRVSFPIGRYGLFRSHLSGAETVALFASLYGLDTKKVIQFTQNFDSLGASMSARTSDWPLAASVKLSLILAVTAPFDIYVVESAVTLIGETTFNEKWQQLFRRCIEGKTLVLSSIRPQTLETFCSKAVVAENGTLRLIDDLAHGIAFYPQRQSSPEPERSMVNVEQDDDSF